MGGAARRSAPRTLGLGCCWDFWLNALAQLSGPFLGLGERQMLKLLLG